MDAGARGGSVGDAGDQSAADVAIDQATEEIGVLARHLPDDFQVASLLSVAQDTSQKSSRLAQLYLDRCFRLSAGDIPQAQALEQEIRSLRGQD